MRWPCNSREKQGRPVYISVYGSVGYDAGWVCHSQSVSCPTSVSSEMNGGVLSFVMRSVMCWTDRGGEGESAFLQRHRSFDWYSGSACRAWKVTVLFPMIEQGLRNVFCTAHIWQTSLTVRPICFLRCGYVFMYIQQSEESLSLSPSEDWRFVYHSTGSIEIHSQCSSRE